MSDRLEDLLKLGQKQRAEAAEKRKAIEASQQRAVVRANAARVAWASKKELFIKEMSDFNGRLEELEIKFFVSQNPNKMRDDIDSLIVTADSRSGHKGIFTVGKLGDVSATTHSLNIVPWHNRHTLIEDMTGEFLREFFSDLLEAKLRPTVRPGA